MKTKIFALIVCFCIIFLSACNLEDTITDSGYTSALQVSIPPENYSKISDEIVGVVRETEFQDTVVDSDAKIIEKEVKKDEITYYIPKILLDKDFEFKIIPSPPDNDLDILYYSYRDKQTTSFSIEKYKFQADVFSCASASDAEETVNIIIGDMRRKYVKNGKTFFFGQSRYSPYLVLYYYLDKKTFIGVAFDTNETAFFADGNYTDGETITIPQEVAEQIYDDFQVVSLGNLEQMSK